MRHDASEQDAADGGALEEGAPESSEPATMPPPAAAPSVEKVGIGPLALEHLVHRSALGEMAASFHKLFGIPIRILSGQGEVLAEAAKAAPLCALVNEQPAGRRACQALVLEATRAAASAKVERSEPCFTGALYRVVPIEYDGRVIGRVLLGPYLPADVTAAPPRLFDVAAGLDPARAAEALTGMARVTPETIAAMVDHLRSVLDLILFSGHKALLTSTMHVASIRESYRELTEKNTELQAAYDRLKELDRLKSNFLATVSHELRTPLTSIMGYSEMLAEGIGGPLAAEQLEFVQTIRTKSDQLLGLIMSLLDLSKLESGTMMVRRGEVTIGEVLADAASTIAPTASKKGVHLRVTTEEDLPLVLGDGDRLRQVFINLAENAVKFTEPGGSVVLSAKAIVEDPDDLPGLVLVAPLRNEVEVRVSDTGIGIPESQRARVFDPFYQIDQSSTREHGGTGLGLSIVKRLIEAHHGAIRIEHNHPRGAVFVVTLPTVGGAGPASSAGPPSSHLFQ
ncbi:MAG: PocR ligand-binding domain-containing protein [Polyangiaceae bacterium]|nr:PocR ligand-binding domain-containing protein [Polyangiaceae bacterium]